MTRKKSADGLYTVKCEFRTGDKLTLNFSSWEPALDFAILARCDPRSVSVCGPDSLTKLFRTAKDAWESYIIWAS